MKIVAFNAFWQEPAITEKHAYDQMCILAPDIYDATYIGFPWATLIDATERGTDVAESLRRELKILLSDCPRTSIVLTVCQHIKYEKYLSLFREIGITDLYASHTPTQTLIQRSIRVHPFQLYPVQLPPADGCSATCDIDEFSRRDVVFSYVGAHSKSYLSPAREWIHQHLTGSDKSIIVRRNEWHYDKQVYNRQILGQELPQEILLEEELRAAEYRAVMARSMFALCPSGTGPNSIRFWESIEFGTIPVLISDTMTLPGQPDDWKNSVVRIPESEEGIKSIPSVLAALLADSALLSRCLSALFRVRDRFGLRSFVRHLLGRTQGQAEAIRKLHMSRTQPVLVLDLSRLPSNSHEAASTRTAQRLLKLDQKHVVHEFSGVQPAHLCDNDEVVNFSLTPYDLLDLSKEVLTIFSLTTLTVHLGKRFRQIVFAPRHATSLDDPFDENDPANRILSKHGKYEASLITSIFKGKRFIPDFLNSLRNYESKDSIEHLCLVADSPTDDLLAISQQVISDDINVVVVNLPADPGLYEVWNLGVTLASGRFIGNTNLDDFRAPTQVADLMATLKRTPEASVASTAIRVSTECTEDWEPPQGDPIWYANMKAELYSGKDLYRIDKIGQAKAHNFPHCAPLWRRDLHHLFGYFDEPRYGPSSDWEFWLRCGGAGTRFVHLPKVGVIYFKSPDTYWRRSKVTASLEDAIVKRHFQAGKLMSRFDGQQSSLLLDVLAQHVFRRQTVSSLVLSAKLAHKPNELSSSAQKFLSLAVTRVVGLCDEEFINILGQNYSDSRDGVVSISYAVSDWIASKNVGQKISPRLQEKILAFGESVLEQCWGQYRCNVALIGMALIAAIEGDGAKTEQLLRRASQEFTTIEFAYVLAQIFPKAWFDQYIDRIAEHNFKPAHFHEYIGKDRVFVFPDYRSGNAYQELLHSGLGAECSNVYHVNEIESLAAGKITSRDVLHIHWINAITAKGPVDHKHVYERFLQNIIRIKNLGAHISWTVHNESNHDPEDSDSELYFRKNLANAVDRIYVHHKIIGRCLLPWLSAGALSKTQYYEHGLYPSRPVSRDHIINIRAQLKIPAGGILAIIVGQIRPYKDLVTYLPAITRALAEIANLHIVVAGRISCKQSADALTSAADDRLLVINSHLDSNTVIDLHQAADFGILTYKKILTSGGLFTALSHNLPVVAPRMGTIPFYVRHGTNGWLYSNEFSFIDAMWSAVAQSQTTRELHHERRTHIPQPKWPVIALHQAIAS